MQKIREGTLSSSCSQLVGNTWWKIFDSYRKQYAQYFVNGITVKFLPIFQRREQKY